MSELLPAQIIKDDLAIQQWTDADVEAMEALIIDNLDHLRPWMAWAVDEPIAPDRRRRLFERWDRYRAASKGAVYSIHVGGELVGGCAIHRRGEPGSVEIGYWLGEQATGRGIATRTSWALLDAAFCLDDIDVVRISHARSNARSGAIAERLGFTREAPRSPDVTRWRMDRGDWPADRPGEIGPRLASG